MCLLPGQLHEPHRLDEGNADRLGLLPGWSLHTFGRRRFVELQRRIDSISPKVLTQRLRRLERDGLVVRTYHPEVPPRVEYEISELGRGLAPLFAHLAEWGTANLERVEWARRHYDDAGSPRS
ncbi:HxlR family transcriptional regulator [Kitasatospora indigofera]|uniref:HxlR family transcriptional regulator n=1 Tax=Kitasatospora indigofera TaxID=67307 RepID=A0A919KJ96_9ACTN|nr:helix-turn-helix domain-containing protein [Kitasatospora indigofera]GHH59314.1 HxlR family transcriptional regulator [Kitasatospora indigofera]